MGHVPKKNMASVEIVVVRRRRWGKQVLRRAADLQLFKEAPCLRALGIKGRQHLRRKRLPEAPRASEAHKAVLRIHHGVGVGEKLGLVDVEAVVEHQLKPGARGIDVASHIVNNLIRMQ